MLCSRINKGKAPKEVSWALSELKDLMAFHLNMSVAIETALQHLAHSLLVHLANLILVRRDAYLEHVKPGVKQVTMNLLCNSPLFGYAHFPDTSEQDISKCESAAIPSGPGPGAPQHTNWRGSHRYRPYEHLEHRSSASTDQSSQQQPWRQFRRSRSTGCGRGFQRVASL